MNITPEQVLKLVQLAMLCGFLGGIAWDMLKQLFAAILSFFSRIEEREERIYEARKRASLFASEEGAQK